MNRLRSKHATEDGRWFGVDFNNANGVCNTYENFVWEPALVKRNVLLSACEVS